MLKFKEGSFMSALWQSSEINSLHSKKIDETELARMMCGKEDLIENNFADEEKDDQEVVDSLQEVLGSKGFDHEDFMREDRGNAACHNIDEDPDQGFGETQLHVMACESVCNESDKEAMLLNDIEESLDKPTVSGQANGKLKSDSSLKEKSVITNNDHASSSKHVQLKSGLQPSLAAAEKKTSTKTSTVKSLLSTKNFCDRQTHLSSTSLYRPSYLG